MFVESYLTSANRQRVHKLVMIAEELDTTPSCLALQWCLRNEIVASAITSATKLPQLVENLKAGEIDIPANVISK